MNRTVIPILLVAALFFGFAATGLATIVNPNSDISILLNGQELVTPVQPSLLNDTIFVPLKSIAERLGAAVTWDAPSKSITMIQDGTEATLAINQDRVTINGLVHTLQVPPFIFQGRTMIPLELLSLVFPVEANWDKGTGKVAIHGPILPTVGSYANLQRLLADAQTSISGLYGTTKEMMRNSAMPAAAEMQNESAKAADSGRGGGTDYSGTNVQVQGVDEADIIKTDGEYIYQINKNRVLVIQAQPADTMQLVSTLKFDEKNFNPQEIYIDAKNLVVIGTAYNEIPLPNPEPRPAEDKAKMGMMPYYRQTGTVKALIYDLSDRTDIVKLREVEMEGYYVSSRKIGSSLYLIANKNIDWYYIMEQDGEDPAPMYRDTAGQEEFTSLPYSDIRYFPGSVEPNYLLVAGLNLEQMDEEMKVTAYLGSGQNIYASLDNLYVAVTQYKQEKEGAIPLNGIMPRMWAPQVKTGVYKFALSDGEVKHLGQGEVPGTILNQFSMDEHNGYFRIATTDHRNLNNEFVSTNNLYVLSAGMEITGKIEDIAPGERIYSVRFMGDRGYMVTFKNVDPLFVIDLKDPQAPTILGALKIPGYSDYLHPYDENHIIGFGKDTIELPQKDWEGKEIGTMAFYQGMKLAIFDVTDVANPKEMFKTSIGDRGTDSELLHNHKALLFSREKNLLSFPVTVMEVKGQTTNPGGFPEYGEFAFQGAYVYDINLEQGFTLQGRITHLESTDYLKSGYGPYYGDLNVQRIIYIGDTLYTISQGKIKANTLNGLTEIGSLTIPQ